MRRNHYPGLLTLLLTLWVSMALCTPSLAGDMALLSIGPRFGFSGKTPILGKEQKHYFQMMDVAAIFKLPWSWPLGENSWGLETRLITSAGLLPAQHVIHTVGPIYGNEGGREAELLAACYRNSLALAARHELVSVAFPSISTGAFGYPREEAARVASTAIAESLRGDERVSEVRLVFFSQGDMNVFLRNHKFDG